MYSYVHSKLSGEAESGFISSALKFDHHSFQGIHYLTFTTKYLGTWILLSFPRTNVNGSAVIASNILSLNMSAYSAEANRRGGGNKRVGVENSKKIAKQGGVGNKRSGWRF